MVGQYRDDKHEELVLDERQFADSLISECMISNRGLYRSGAFSRRRSLYVKTDYPKTPVLPKIEWPHT